MDYEEFVRIFRARAAARMAEFDARIAEADKHLSATRASVGKAANKTAKNNPAAHNGPSNADAYLPASTMPSDPTNAPSGIKQTPGEPQRLRHAAPTGKTRARKVKRIMG